MLPYKQNLKAHIPSALYLKKYFKRNAAIGEPGYSAEEKFKAQKQNVKKPRTEPKKWLNNMSFVQHASRCACGSV